MSVKCPPTLSFSVPQLCATRVESALHSTSGADAVGRQRLVQIICRWALKGLGGNNNDNSHSGAVCLLWGRNSVRGAIVFFMIALSAYLMSPYDITRVIVDLLLSVVRQRSSSHAE